MTDNGKKMPFEAIMAIVIMLITTAIAVDGFFIHKLSADALRYPVFCMICIYLSGGMEIYHAYKKRKSEAEKEEKPVHTNLTNLLITVGMFVGYAVLMYLVGFIISSIALTVAFTLKFKLKNALWINLGAAVVIAAVYFLMRNYLYIFLPRGLLISMIF